MVKSNENFVDPLDEIDPIMDDAFSVSSDTNENNNVIFNNIEYTKMPIEADGFQFNGKQTPRPRLRISNILGTFTTILLTLPQGLEGAQVTRIRTLARYVDNANFTGGQILLENGSNLLLEDGFAIDMDQGVNPFGTPDPTATLSLIHI